MLQLNQPYENLQSKFNSQRFRDLKKAEKLKLQLSQFDSPDEFIRDYKRSPSFSKQKVEAKHLRILKQLMAESLINKKGKLFCVMNEKREKLAAMFCVVNSKSITNLVNFTYANAERSGAQTFLISELIKQYCNANMLFDFEGSDLSGIASFYESFGSKNLSYRHLYCNRLPLLLRSFK